MDVIVALIELWLCDEVVDECVMDIHDIVMVEIDEMDDELEVDVMVFSNLYDENEYNEMIDEHQHQQLHHEVDDEHEVNENLTKGYDESEYVVILSER